MRLAQSGIWHSCQNAGQRHKQKDFVILCAFTGSLFCWSTWELLKKPVKCAFWRRQYSETLDISVGLSRIFSNIYLWINGFYAWKNLLVVFFEKVGIWRFLKNQPIRRIWPSNLPTYRGIWPKFFKESNARGFARWGWGGGGWVVLELNVRLGKLRGVHHQENTSNNDTSSFSSCI